MADIYGTFTANWESGGTDYQLATAPHDGRFAFPNYNERVPMAAAAARYDRRNRGGGTAPESYWKNGNTVMVPILAPIREETTIKQTILLKTLEAAKNLRSEHGKAAIKQKAPVTKWSDVVIWNEELHSKSNIEIVQKSGNQYLMPSLRIIGTYSRKKVCKSPSWDTNSTSIRAQHSQYAVPNRDTAHTKAE